MTDQKRIMDMIPIPLDKTPLSAVEMARSIWPLEWDDDFDDGEQITAYVEINKLVGFVATIKRQGVDGVHYFGYCMDGYHEVCISEGHTLTECVTALRARVIEVLEEALREVRG